MTNNRAAARLALVVEREAIEHAIEQVFFAINVENLKLRLDELNQQLRELDQ